MLVYQSEFDHESIIRLRMENDQLIRFLYLKGQITKDNLAIQHILEVNLPFAKP